MRIAILDLYKGQANQGMRCIRQLIREFGEQSRVEISFDEFDVRLKQELPDLSYDAYISSGGPGSPLESKGSEWEEKYFSWIKTVAFWNNQEENQQKKPVFFICHSFQLATRYFNIAHVTKRKSTAFGVFPVHIMPSGKREPVFKGLTDPFYVVDSRDYQVIQPDYLKMKQMGAHVLCIEKFRPHVPYEQAIMGIRFNPFMIGTQFHPEADAHGMSIHLQTEERKKIVIENHGEAKWQSMIDQLNDPDKIMFTYAHVLPNFLKQALEQLQKVFATL
jgi:homoserine O-succinyltransferase